jgi:hypothetical protein
MMMPRDGGLYLQMPDASYFSPVNHFYGKEKQMAELQATSTEYTLDTVNLSVENPGLDLVEATALAKAKARDMDSNAMMLSYHSGKTGEFWPHYDCGGPGRPPWIVFAESRGYNLKIDINDGDFEFFYLRF